MRIPARWILGFGLLLPAAGFGQTPGAAPPAGIPKAGVPPVENAPGPGVPGPVPPEQIAPPAAGSAARQGVAIVPPNVDPAIDKAPPRVRSAMPVIPPPGSPGSGSTVQPK